MKKKIIITCLNHHFDFIVELTRSDLIKEDVALKNKWKKKKLIVKCNRKDKNRLVIGLEKLFNKAKEHKILGIRMVK